MKAQLENREETISIEQRGIKKEQGMGERESGGAGGVTEVILCRRKSTDLELPSRTAAGWVIGL